MREALVLEFEFCFSLWATIRLLKFAGTMIGSALDDEKHLLLDLGQQGLLCLVDRKCDKCM